MDEAAAKVEAEPWVICIRKSDTWCWPSYLDTRMEGACAFCNCRIFYEKKNERYQKMCGQCWGDRRTDI